MDQIPRKEVHRNTPLSAVPGIQASIEGSNKINSENIKTLHEVLFRLTGSKDTPAPMQETDESIRGLISDTIQQAHEIEELARRIFEAL